MFRNQYDTDVTVWSPEGRLLQVGKDRFPRAVALLVSVACVDILLLTSFFDRLNTPWNL